MLEEFVKEARFDWLGVFSYSDEEGSGAHGMDGQGAEADYRSAAATADEAATRDQQTRQTGVGGARGGAAGRGRELRDAAVVGRPDEFHAPEIDGKVYINDFGPLEALEAGRFYRAEITEAHEYDVVARVVSEAL